MLETLRNASKGWVAKIFLGLLVLSFAVWGIADVFRGFSAGDLATVGGISISEQDYKRSLERTLRVYSKQLNQNITAERARELGIDKQVLGDLVRSAAVEAEAKSLGLTVSEQSIAAEIAANLTYQDSNGKFDPIRFRETLQNNNLSEAGYIARERLQRMREAITTTADADFVAPQTLLEAAYRHQNEQRDARYFIAKTVESEISAPTESEVKAYYEKFPVTFTAPEYRTIALIKADPADVSAGLQVSADEVANSYADKKASYFSPERRTILQIVFPSKAEAQKAQERINAGEDFLVIAKERGLTPEDATLGTVTKQDLIDDKITAAAFGLAEGKVSDPVEGRLSIVLLKVTKIEPEHQQSFEEAKKAVTGQLQLDKAAAAIRTIYDQVEAARDSQTPFEEIAAKQSIPFIKAGPFDASGLGRDGKPVEFPHKAELLKLAFDTEAGVDTAPVQTADNGYAWYAVREVIPATARPFEEVKDKARAGLVATRIREASIAKGKALAERARGGVKLEDLAREVNAEVKTVQGLKRNESSGEFDTQAVTALFSVKEGGFAFAVEGDGAGVKIMKSDAVLLPAFSKTSLEAAKLAKTLNQDAGRDLLGQYLQGLETRIGANINNDVWRQISGAPAN